MSQQGCPAQNLFLIKYYKATILFTTGEKVNLEQKEHYTTFTEHKWTSNTNLEEENKLPLSKTKGILPTLCHQWHSKRKHSTPVEKELQELQETISKNHYNEIRTKIWGDPTGKLFKQFQSVHAWPSQIISSFLAREDVKCQDFEATVLRFKKQCSISLFLSFLPNSLHFLLLLIPSKTRQVEISHPVC